ncbi:hypothetical protein BLA29_006287 [Euroglyphus maynei]|uniref:Uncharacterized protein n=1 Tax=Euroglyphus maynei TaxID=6958 RepID=A0A1Y3B4P1_EURMA|nr:hypothetical protein BLA29_006287 [Euroglyphus maynei]
MLFTFVMLLQISIVSRYMCYFSDSGGNVWQIVGRSIDSFEGFELASGKFFAIDYDRPAYFQTPDGITWTPIEYEQFNRTLEHPKFQRKMIIPRFAFDDLNKMNVRIGNWRGNYYYYFITLSYSQSYHGKLFLSFSRKLSHYQPIIKD